MRSCLAGIALAALCISAASATIFPPATVKGIYQQTTSSATTNPPTVTSCVGFSFCFFVFDRVPNDKQLIITSVSCSLTLAAGGIENVWLRLQRPNDLLVDRIQALRASKAEGNNFVVNDTALMPVDGRIRPLVHIITSLATTIGGFCTIAGEISNAP
jgi:hypothetical protein